MHGDIEGRVGDRLDAAGATLAVAESCTGGLVASRLTDVPGASAYFDRGIVSYSNAAKRETLGVAGEALDDHGAVSAPVARSMALGVAEAAGTDWGLSTTGYAGPTGGDADAPVGTVFVGVASGDDDWVERHTFEGQRHEVKEHVAETALEVLLYHLKE